MRLETFARLEEKFRKQLTRLPPPTTISLYSYGRVQFIKALEKEKPPAWTPPAQIGKTLWGIYFRAPIFNAAGMYKNGECYELAARQGAGAYLAGTTTANPRAGNRKSGIKLPFVPYPISGAASNWLGLPNKGDEYVAQRLEKVEKVYGCPIGISVMGSPDINGVERLEELVKGMKRYENANVDFIELNESCPNTHGSAQDNGLADRLHYISARFLQERKRKLPVIVKFSNDTRVEHLPHLLDNLFELGYDGITLGNTSTKYADLKKAIAPRERRLFDFFTKTFGGGVSGAPLLEQSLLLGKAAAQYLADGPPTNAFHIIGAGGRRMAKDVKSSRECGIELDQWFTGYFENFAIHGHDLYKDIIGAI